MKRFVVALTLVLGCTNDVGGTGTGEGDDVGTGSDSGSGSGSAETAPAGFVFSAYKDTSIDMDWNSNVISTSVSGTRTALADDLAGVHYWSYDRDNDCPAGSASPTCNSLGGAGTRGFLARFIGDGMK